MLILGVEPNLTAYKTVVRTDTLYELFVTSFVLKIIFYFELLYETTPPIIFYIYDHPRTRTWNLLIRSQVRCPITPDGHFLDNEGFDPPTSFFEEG